MNTDHNRKTHSHFAKNARMGFVENDENQMNVYIDIDRNVEFHYNNNGAEWHIIKNFRRNYSYENE